MTAASTQTEIPKSLPPLIVKYSWPKLIFCFLASLGATALQIWVVIRPWLVSFSHPDLNIWNDKLLGLVALTPFFLPLWMTYLSYYIHIIRQAWRGEVAVSYLIAEFSRRIGDTLSLGIR